MTEVTNRDRDDARTILTTILAGQDVSAKIPQLALMLANRREEGRREAIEAVCAQQAAPPWYAKGTRLAAIRSLVTNWEN